VIRLDSKLCQESQDVARGRWHDRYCKIELDVGEQDAELELKYAEKL
jgi:hypothetical protein